MSAGDLITIGNAQVFPPPDTRQNYPFPQRCTVYQKDGIPTLTMFVRGGALPGLPDRYAAKPLVWSYNGTKYFVGDVTEGPIAAYDDRYGWGLQYQASGIRRRANRMPHTDSNTGTDVSMYNLSPQDSTNYIASRAGRTIGQILADVLTMLTNALSLASFGLGGYTSLGPPTLPAATLADLANLTVIPPAPVYFQGQRFLGAIEGLLSDWAPNVTLWIDPTGTFRFLDMRAFPSTTLTMDSDPILPTPLKRGWGDCFQRVAVRGNPIAEPVLLSLSNGGLQEDFTWGPYTTNAQAKAAWTPASWQSAQTAQDSGTCTCPSTTTVTVTSAFPTTFWQVDFWDQTVNGRHGVIYLSYSAGSGVTSRVSRNIIACTQLTPGGTSTLTLDLPLPNLNFDGYEIYGTQDPSSIVWRRYKATDPAIGAALAPAFTGLVAFKNSGNGAASLVSVPTGSVVWQSPGSTTLQEFPVPFSQDPSSGTFLFNLPTYIVAGNQAPSDVKVLAAVYKGVNLAICPPNDPYTGASVYGGTSYTVEGKKDTLWVTCLDWRDPANATSMETYACDLLDSVKDTIVEGEITYLDVYTPALTMGMALNVAGSGYTTGWESLTSFSGFPGLPITEVEVEWPESDGVLHRTHMHASNRRAAFSSSYFLKPDRTGVQIGLDSDSDGLFGTHSNFSGGTGLGGLGGGGGEGDLPTSPAEFMGSQGLPTTPGDLGIPTSPADFFGMGGGEQVGGAPGLGGDAPEPPSEPEPPPDDVAPPDFKPGG